MRTQQNNKPPLPVKGSLVIFYVLSSLVAILVAGVSIPGLIDRSLFYPTEEFVRSFVPNDVVNLFIGLPILLGSMGLAWRSKWIGLLCWPGALFYVFYNSMGYAIALPPNWAFLIHLTLVVVSVYTLLGLVASMDGKAVKQRLHGAVPEKVTGGVLAGLGFLFFLRAILFIVNALTSGILPAETEMAVNSSDLLITPAWVVGGLLLWRQKELGYVTGLGLLFQGSMLFIALIVFLLLQPFLTRVSFAFTDLLLILGMGLICFIPFGLFIRGVVRSQRQPFEKGERHENS